MLLKGKQWPKITATGLRVGRVFVLKRKPLSAFKKESFSRTDCWGLESQKTWDLWEMQNDKYFGRWMSCLSTVCHTLCGVFVVSCRNSVFFIVFLLLCWSIFLTSELSWNSSGGYNTLVSVGQIYLLNLMFYFIPTCMYVPIYIRRGKPVQKSYSVLTPGAC